MPGLTPRSGTPRHGSWLSLPEVTVEDLARDFEKSFAEHNICVDGRSAPHDAVRPADRVSAAPRNLAPPASSGTGRAVAARLPV